MEDLRNQEKKIKSAASLRPYRLLEELSRNDPEKYGLDLSMPNVTSPTPIRTVGSSAVSPKFAGGGKASKGFSRGGANGKTINARVSNGEAFVPRNLAQDIGYGTLDRLNQAIVS